MTRKSRTFLAVVALFGIALSASPAFSWPDDIAPPPPAAPALLFFSGPQPITQLTVGENLHVALIGGSPNTTYSVSLQDEWGQEISQMPVTTYASGHSGREWLWEETGLVGCEPWNLPLDPTAYEYHDLREAEAALHGRTFEVVVSYGAWILTTENLPLVADPSQIAAYISDGAGCRRHALIEHEPIHVSFLHIPPLTPVWIYVTPSQPTWQTGDPINDVSQDGPDFAQLPFAPGINTVSAGLVGNGPGYYDVIVRYGFNQNLVFDELTDTVPGGNLPSMDSRTYQPCASYCPP